jgi:enoyl-CoA hydratase/carnithine racemase
MQEVKIGIPSVIEAALSPTLVGWGRTREILYLGETFTAPDALAWRLIEHWFRQRLSTKRSRPGSASC